MAVTQSTFESWRKQAYAGMPADGRYKRVDGVQLIGGEAVFGSVFSMGDTEKTVNAGASFDPTRPFGGLCTRLFYQGNGGIGETTTRPFTAEQKVWLDAGTEGTWWVPVNNDAKNGDRFEVTAAGEITSSPADAPTEGNYYLEGATFVSSRNKDGLIKVELTGGRTFVLIEAAPVA
ncbi:hypothetical protein P5E67_05015 [Vibrio parahaemolyticus]|nr:hypothetical protein [Vibrio parahaemolyticus]